MFINSNKDRLMVKKDGAFISKEQEKFAANIKEKTS